MRGKLVNPDYKLLWSALVEYAISIIGFINFLFGHRWYLAIVPTLALIAGIAVTILWWTQNHPRLPKWAEDAMKETGDEPDD